MLADADRPVASNGTSRPYANGKSHQRSSVSGAANGTSKAVNGSSKVRQSETYFGHDREEVTRLLIQALTDMGYQSAAQSVSQESGFELESPMVAAFRNAILEGDWAEAEQLLSGAIISGHRVGEDGNGLVLTNGANRRMMQFWIRQQKFLELLEQRQTARALAVLRTELTPLYQDTQKLHFLSSLLMCQKTEDLKSKAEWDGAYGESRHILLSQLSKCISPSVMLPEHRLATLLTQVKANQVDRCYWHSCATSPSLYSDHACERQQFPTENVLELDEHAEQVWQVVFSHDGTKLASCGQGKQVIIWDVPSFRPLHYLNDHDDGVGNVAWSWDDSMIITCCQDRHARLWDANTGACLKKLERCQEPVTSCVWAVDGRTFVTGALDKTHGLIQWNLDGEKVHDWNSPHRVEDLAMSPDGHWLVASDGGTNVHVYNFVTRELEYQMDLQVRLTSISISQNSRHLLVNHNNGIAQLIDLIRREPVGTYTGFTSENFMIRSAFGGADESFVISGSEDGSINIWHKASARLVEKLTGHIPGCNSVSWNPADPCLFASCGDDGKIKIWSNNSWRSQHYDANRAVDGS
ncbi:WD domain-containing protein [Annulohypoxylon maeteangense]|uniref:WD domain-containing protein n=1 Tax=Annulohypoxylon maeteangense TaxID=1927788 RepID=UPI0020074A05|nr:WD domain-containing protein [Annulohypoxylon maeteangense]KAI0884447.1 WD domain-containing protein [Annulohypoxylon maeteangense]